MTSKHISFVFASLLVGATLVQAQNNGQQNSASPQNQPQQPQNLHRGNGFVPCWQQASIQKSVMEQRWAIERETHSQVEAVCSNSSLTPLQKRQQVTEIRQQGRQKAEALVTPEQEKTLTACQQERGGRPGGGTHEGMGGGCGEWQRGGPHSGAAPNSGTGTGNGSGSGSGSGSGTPPPPTHE
jgi:hypothetical protein